MISEKTSRNYSLPHPENVEKLRFLLTEVLNKLEDF
jgi:hypothetical protein